VIADGENSQERIQWGLISESFGDARMATDDFALHTVLCAAGFNIRWLMRAIARLGLAALLLACSALARWLALAAGPSPSPRGEMCSFLAGLAHQHRRGFNALAAAVR